MVVFAMENIPENFRGELTRWMIEVKAGVFVGNITQVVRNILWDKICKYENSGAAVMIFSFNNEQGFSMEMCGQPRRRVVDLEGVFLISTII